MSCVNFTLSIICFALKTLEGCIWYWDFHSLDRLHLMQSLWLSLWKIVRRLEKSSPAPLVAQRQWQIKGMAGGGQDQPESHGGGDEESWARNWSPETNRANKMSQIEKSASKGEEAPGTSEVFSSDTNYIISKNHLVSMTHKLYIYPFKHKISGNVFMHQSDFWTLHDNQGWTTSMVWPGAKTIRWTKKL